MEDIHVPADSESLTLDIFGQAERINHLYTQVTLCFPVRDDSPSLRAEVVDNLEKGLARLARQFPWVGGKVVQDEEGFKITATPTAPSLVVKELQDHDTVPSWDELEQANFPFRMLDEDAVAPCKTMVEPEAERPVFLVQANFVQGGLLLTFNAQHGSMDMTGQAQVITLFAKAVRGEDFTKEELEVGNMKRTGWIPIPDHGTIPICDHSSLGPREPPTPGQDETGDDASARPSPPGSQPGVPSDNLVWAYFEFTAASLAELKHLATQGLEDPNADFVSTDDVLTVLIWQSITRARQPRLDLKSAQLTTTTLTRNVDIRRYFDLPPTYPGLMTTSTSEGYRVDYIANHIPLGVVASGLRAKLRPYLAAFMKISVQAQASAIARAKGAEAGRISAATSNPRFDVKLSSWAKVKLYDLDFGPGLGRPEAVRRPKFGNGAREGLVYFLPKGRDGSIVVGICLKEEDMDRLRVDEELVRWAWWIG